MTTQELHIGIDLELQHLASYQEKNLQPQEKDWFINKEVNKFLESRLSPESNMKQTGFEDTLERTKELTDLKRTSKYLKLEEDEEGIGLVSLPSNLFHPIRVDLLLAKDCNQTIKNTKKNEYKVKFKIDVDVDVINNFSIQITTTEGLKTVFDINTDLPVDYISSIGFKKQRFILIKALKIVLPKKLETILTTPFDLYWENDRDNTRENYTFFLYTNDVLFNSVITYNNTSTNYPAVISEDWNYDRKNYPILSNCRLVDDEFFTDAINSHLAASSAKSPLARWVNNRLEIAKPRGVVMGGVRVTYICKPNLSDLLLDSNINMSRNTLEKILVNTVAYMKAIISSPNYNAYKQENILIE